jgi:hypothetical protein
MALLIAFGPAYHSGLYGSTSEIRSMPCLSARGRDREGRTIFVADDHRDNGKRFIVTADEKPPHEAGR